MRRDIPFILLTGYGTLELEKKAFQEGAYAVVIKPVNVDVLLSVVTHAIPLYLRQTKSLPVGSSRGFLNPWWAVCV